MDHTTVEYSFLKQLQGEKTRGGTYLDSLFMNKEEVAWDIKVKTSFGNNGSVMMGFIVLREMRNSSSRIMILDFSELTSVCSGICLASTH